jgi:hypothetical protein
VIHIFFVAATFRSMRGLIRATRTTCAFAASPLGIDTGDYPLSQ